MENSGIYNIMDLIIKVGGVSGVITVFFGLIKKLMKWIDLQEEQAENLRNLKIKEEQDISRLKENFISERNCIKEEQQLICYGLMACLDGLQQLGANHSVPRAKDKLEKHLNKSAHE